MIDKLESIKDTVFKILTEEPKTRDSDRLLIIKVWSKQNPHLRRADYHFRRFALDFLEGIYADTESIRRCRQKIQEQHQSLRGSKYLKRKEEDDAMRVHMAKMQTGRLFDVPVKKEEE